MRRIILIFIALGILFSSLAYAQDPLCASTNPLEEGESKTYLISGNTYEVSLNFVGDDGQVDFSVNGENLDLMQQLEIRILLDGAQLGVAGVVHPESGPGLRSAEFCINGEAGISLDLSDYPSQFIDNGQFIGNVVVGDQAPAEDAQTSADILAGVEAVATIPSEAVKKDIDILSIGKPLISVGCNNQITLDILGLVSEEVCRGAIETKGTLRMINHQGQPVLIVTGNTDLGTQMSGAVMNEYDKYNLQGQTNYVNGDGLDNIQLSHVLPVAPPPVYSLEDYPGLFIKDNQFKGLIVVGDEAPSDDALAAVDVATGIATLTEGGTLLNTLASQLGSIDSPLISIGCNNPLSIDILGVNNEDQCRFLFESEGFIAIRNFKGQPSIVLAGETGSGTRIAARVIQNYEKYKGSFVGNEILLEGDLNNIIFFATEEEIPANLDFIEYPFQFMKNGAFSGSVVVGDTASVDDVLAALDVTAGLQSTGFVVPIEASKLASEVTLDQTIISIGCNNQITLDLVGFETIEECRQEIADEGFVGALYIDEKNLHPYIMVAGVTELGTRMAAKVLKDYNLFNVAGQLIGVTGTSLDDIQVVIPSALPQLEGTLDIELDFSGSFGSPTTTEDISTAAEYKFDLYLEATPSGPPDAHALLNSKFTDLTPGAHTYSINYNEQIVGSLVIEAAQDTLTLKEVSISLPDLPLEEWVTSGVEVSGWLTFSLIENDVQGGKMAMNFVFNDLDDINVFSLFEEGASNSLGNVVVEVDLTNPGVPPQEFIKNVFYGSVTYLDGEYLDGTASLSAIVNGATINQEFLNGFYTDFVVKGQEGDIIDFYVNGLFADQVIMESVREPILLDFILPVGAPDHFRDNDQDGVPNQQDECPGSTSYLVDIFGCDCEQKVCENSYCTFLDETNPIPVCASTCYDGLQNQEEVGVDCGGSCFEECPTCLGYAGACLGDSPPKFCQDETAEPVNKCSSCGCPQGFVCEEDEQCYKTVELENLQCKVNEFDYAASRDCTELELPPLDSWVTTLQLRWEVEENKSEQILERLTELYDTHDKESLAQILHEEFGVEKTRAPGIVAFYEDNWGETSEWFKEELLQYIQVRVGGVPSWLARDIRKDIEKELKAVTLCINTKEACVLPETECPGQEILEEKKSEVQSIAQAELNSQTRRSTPGWAKFLGLNVQLGIDLGSFELKVSSNETCEPARITPELSCKEFISNGPTEEKADIVFIGDQIFSDEELQSIMAETLDYEGEFFDTPFEGLFSREPYKSSKEKFNIWFMNSANQIRYDADERDISQGAIPSVDDVLELSTFCPQADYVVVLSAQPYRSFCFPETGPCFVSIYNEDFIGRLLAHELGHGFAGLTDEYYNRIEQEDNEEILEDLFALGALGPNCQEGKPQAQEFWGDLTGGRVDFFAGCGGDCGAQCAEYVRPTLNSIMNDQNLDTDNAEECLDAEEFREECIGPPFDSYYSVNEREILEVLGNYR